MYKFGIGILILIAILVWGAVIARWGEAREEARVNAYIGIMCNWQSDMTCDVEFVRNEHWTDAVFCASLEYSERAFEACMRGRGVIP